MAKEKEPEQQMDLGEARPAETTPLPVEEPKANGGHDQAIVPAPEISPPERAISAFASGESFAVAQRVAKALAASSLMPKEYQNNIPNALIAIELASRIGCSVLMVAQNLDIIHGRPSWRATFLIATVNSCGRFTPLRFRWQGDEGSDSWGCRAVAKDRASGDECIGTLITIGLAKKEGWFQKNGSKWQTMAEQMLCYRAAAFWARIYAPELSLGMQTSDEVIDTVGEEVSSMPAQMAPGSAASLEATLRARGNGNGTVTA